MLAGTETGTGTSEAVGHIRCTATRRSATGPDRDAVEVMVARRVLIPDAYSDWHI